jgi:hypothetical protein
MQKAVELLYTDTSLEKLEKLLTLLPTATAEMESYVTSYNAQRGPEIVSITVPVCVILQTVNKQESDKKKAK